MADPTAVPAPEPVAFIAGATGYTGQGLVAALRRRGHVTWAHVRPDSRQRDRWRDYFAADGAGVDATPWEADAMRDTLARIRPTHVFLVLGTTRARADRDTNSAVPETYEAVDYGLSRLMLDAARPLVPPPTIVYLSSLGANEKSGNPYLAVRGRFERELRASGLPWLIVRPSFITGPDRLEKRTMERIGAVATDLLMGILAPVIGRRTGDRWRAITGPELGEGMVRLAVDRGVTGRVVDMGDVRATFGAHG